MSEYILFLTNYLDPDQYLIITWVIFSVIISAVGLSGYKKDKKNTVLAVLGGFSLLLFSSFWLSPTFTQTKYLTAENLKLVDQYESEKKAHHATRTMFDQNTNIRVLRNKQISNLSNSIRDALSKQNNIYGLFLPPVETDKLRENAPPQRQLKYIKSAVKSLSSARPDESQVDYIIEQVGLIEKKWKVRINSEASTKGNLNLSEKFSYILTRLDRLKQISPNLAKPAGPKPRQNQLETKLDGGISSDYYTIEKLQHREYIKGYKGAYYTISLEAPGKPNKLAFSSGQYVYDKLVSMKLRLSAQYFSSEILSRIPTAFKKVLFIRGNANGRQWSGNLGDDQFFEKIEFLKGTRENGYGAEKTAHVFNQLLNNNDLPYLRAAFVQNLLVGIDLFGVTRILEGSPSLNVRLEQGRTVDLILYVDWRQSD